MSFFFLLFFFADGGFSRTLIGSEFPRAASVKNQLIVIFRIPDMVIKHITPLQIIFKISVISKYIKIHPAGTILKYSNSNIMNSN